MGLSNHIALRDVTALRKHAQARKGSKKQHSRYGRTVFALGAVCVALVGVMVWPSPYKAPTGGIELVGSDPEVAIYGPEIPTSIVGGYTAPSIQSVVLPEPEDGDTTYYVYATENQENYHSPTCKFAYASAKCMTLYEAYFQNYTPGPCCSPPSYTP